MIHACIRPPSGVKVSKIMADFSHSLSLQATGAALSVLDGMGDSLLPGFVAASLPAPVLELGRWAACV